MGKTTQSIYKEEIFRVLHNALGYIDLRLMDHGERVAYIAYELYRTGVLDQEIDLNTLLLLCLFHDVGAYKTEEIEDMVHFESGDVWEHSVYGYCFLKNITPLGETAEAVLFHHLPRSRYGQVSSRYLPYAALIHLADRTDVGLLQYGADFVPEQLQKARGQFDQADVGLLRRAMYNSDLLRNLESGAYLLIVRELISGIDLPLEEALQYLKMLVYSIDFRSEFTVTHTINTATISVELARLLGEDHAGREKIYLGAMLHDIGKIVIPLDILEYPGPLSPEKMEIMRSHVSYSEEIISGLVSDEICQIAIRHHEKLDGSGYPHGLTGDLLSTPQRIVAVADIISALSDQRSYKTAFPKEQTMQLLARMQRDGLLDERVCAVAQAHYDDIMQVAGRRQEVAIQLYQDIAEEYADKMARYGTARAKK